MRGSHARAVRKYRRGLSNKPTRFERLFVERVLDLGLRPPEQVKFQVIIGPYIVDFLFPKVMTVVEIDGPSHKLRRKFDACRDSFLRRCGFTVERIANEVVETTPLEFLCGETCDEVELRRCLSKASNRKSQELINLAALKAAL